LLEKKIFFLSKCKQVLQAHEFMTENILAVKSNIFFILFVRHMVVVKLRPLPTFATLTLVPLSLGGSGKKP
jgi:hypothetical protein